MDRLRSPGGCPWDAEQDHVSLIPYAIEEVHELAEAAELGDRTHLREELGDVLLQVVFHARIAQEDEDDPFDIEDIARVCADKLVDRHPHVFGDEHVDETTDHHRRWDAIKAQTQQRASVTDGVPPGLSAVARAQKVLGRAQRAGLDVEIDGKDFGAQLLSIVQQAHGSGVDAEQALRGAVRRLEERVRAQEGVGPTSLPT